MVAADFQAIANRSAPSECLAGLYSRLLEQVRAIAQQ